MRVAAKRLATFVDKTLREWRQATDNSQAKLVLVADGEGGLVASWFTDVLGGHRDTRLLVTLGTPFRGQVTNLEVLVNGRRHFGHANLDRLTQSMTSLYQALPSYPCLYHDNSSSARRLDPGDIPHADRGRVAETLTFLPELAEAGAERACFVESEMRYVPVVGIEYPTPQSARLVEGRVETMRVYEGEDYGGDGAVPRFSAVPPWINDATVPVYSRARHGQLQADPEVLRLLEVLVTAREADIPELRTAPMDAVRLRVAEAYREAEPITIEVADLTVSALVSVEDERDGKVRQVVRVPIPPDPPTTVTLAPQPPGVYRINVAIDNRRVASDVIVVLRLDDSLT